MCRALIDDREDIFSVRSLRLREFFWHEEICVPALEEGIWRDNGYIPVHYFKALTRLELICMHPYRQQLFYRSNINPEDHERCRKLVLEYFERRAIRDPELKVPQITILPYQSTRFQRGGL